MTNCRLSLCIYQQTRFFINVECFFYSWKEKTTTTTTRTVVWNFCTFTFRLRLIHSCDACDACGHTPCKLLFFNKCDTTKYLFWYDVYVDVDFDDDDASHILCGSYTFDMCFRLKGNVKLLVNSLTITTSIIRLSKRNRKHSH